MDGGTVAHFGQLHPDVAASRKLKQDVYVAELFMDKLFRPYADKLQVRMELPSVGMIKSFVAAGLGVSIISASFARDQVLAGRVKLIPIKGEELWRELGVAYRRDRTLTRATDTFINTVRQLAATLK